MEPIDQELEEGELELPSQPMSLNMGPSHPAMHGTIRIVMELSGETILKTDVQIGYLHRGFEKMCERGSYSQVFPYVDRCNPLLHITTSASRSPGEAARLRCTSAPYYRVLGELSRTTISHAPAHGHGVVAFTLFYGQKGVKCLRHHGRGDVRA